MDSICFSETFELRSRAFRRIHELTTSIDELASELVDLDNGVQALIAVNCVDSQQDLANVVRRLAALLGGGHA